MLHSLNLNFNRALCNSVSLGHADASTYLSVNIKACNRGNQLNREQRDGYAWRIDAGQFINRIIDLISLECTTPKPRWHDDKVDPSQSPNNSLPALLVAPSKFFEDSPFRTVLPPFSSSIFFFISNKGERAEKIEGSLASL